jgi:hypothetical protein
MIRFVITSQRFIEACTVTEYIGVLVGSMAAQMAVLPRMLVDDKGNYIVQITHNEDGDPVEYKNVSKAEKIMDKIGVPRFEKLRKELTEAAKGIVNPPTGDDSTKPPPQ